MSVGTWDPRGSGQPLSESVVAELLTAAGRLEGDAIGLDPAAADRLAAHARHEDDGGSDWRPWARRLEEAELIALIRLFTLGEARFESWAAGDASPVIPLAAELKRRDAYPAELTGWIRAHSSNRFLPYGNLLKRL